MEIYFSIIVPVYNRPDEVNELLESLTKQTYEHCFEIIIVEDGSTLKCDSIVKKFATQLNVIYVYKDNSGAGASRNYGMHLAKGNYFIILDSDVLVPKNYLQIVYKKLQTNYTNAFGGPDAAHKSFSSIQKAINYSMTSFLTTGGIRGKKNGIGKYQLRSYNLGISKEAFSVTKGFSNMKTGEDIDLTFRLWQNGFTTQLISDAFVYHKRRTSIIQFFKQTYSFGKARPILNTKYPTSKKLMFWLPSLFIIGFTLSLLLVLFSYVELFSFYYLYFIAVFIHASFVNNFRVGFLTVLTTFIQMFGYGLGFLVSQFLKAKNVN